MKNTISRTFAAFVCVFMSVAFIAFTVQARGTVNVEKKASLTLNYVSENATFSIYKVGDISTYGELSLSGDFTKYPILLNNDQDSWRELATTLKGYVAKDNISPEKTGKIGTDKKLKFSDLSVGLYLVIGENTVEKVNNIKTVFTPSPFMICLPNIVGESSEWIYDVSASPKYEKTEEEVIDIEVLKVWDDKGYEQSRPASVEVQLMRGNQVYDTQILNEGNNWKYTWNELSSKDEWSIVEKNVPSDYTVKISKSGNKYAITNTSISKPTTISTTTNNNTDKNKTTKKQNKTSADKTQNKTKDSNTTSKNTDTPDNDSKLPQTGLLWWPVGLLLVAGMTLLLVGIIRKTRDNK